MSWGYVNNLVTRTIREWLKDNAIIYSAALAYYFVLSLPALLLFSVSIGSIFLKSEHLQSTIINGLQGAADERVVNMIILLFERIPKINSFSISALVGFIFLLWSASNIFRQLKKFLERAWDIKTTKPNRIKNFTRDTIMSFAIVIFFGCLLSISIFVERFLYTASKLFQQFSPFSPVNANYTGSIASFLILVLFFIFIYKVLPDKSFNFKSIFVGSIVTFLLFYYSSIMITLGAEFTKVYSES